MFKFLTHRHNRAPDLLTSSLLTEQNFYNTFLHDLKHCQKKVIIESPYMTTARVTKLAPTLKKLVKRGVKIRVNTRFPNHHTYVLKMQAYKATQLLKSLGVHVYYYHDYHHRKIAILDDGVTYEGSLNILSQGKSREIMRRIESEALTKQMKHFLGRDNIRC